MLCCGEDMGHRIEELGSLNQLRGRLRVHNLMLVKGREEAEKANMIAKKGMQELVFHFGLERRGLFHIQCSNQADVLEGLQPHKNLKGLRLEMFEGYQFASWMTSVDPQFLQNLVKIELRYCIICEQVPTLGHLPHLEVVEMAHWNNLKRIGPEFYGLDEGIVGCSSSSSGAARSEVVFPALRKLSLHDMRNLEEWSDVSSLLATATNEIKFFPCLKELLISNCPGLITIPTLGHLPHLEVIVMEGLDELKCIGPEFYGLDEGSVGCSSTSSGTARSGVVFPALRKRSLRDMGKLEEWLDVSSLPATATNEIKFFPCLKELLISNCPRLTIIPTLGHLPHLEVIEMEGLDKLKCIGPEFYGLDEGSVGCSSTSSGAARSGVVFPKLRKLSLHDMHKLEEWSDVSSLLATATSEIKFFPCLKELLISNCPRLITIPGQLLSLQSITISSHCPLWFESHMINSPSLWMKVDRKSELIALFMEDLLGKSKSLSNLEIEGLDELRCLPNQLLSLNSLEKLRIKSCYELRCLPRGLLQPTLAEFHLEECESLECDESCSLTSLKKMSILGCSRWGSFWEKGLVCLTSLQIFQIGGFSEHLLHFPWPSYPPQQCPFISLESLELVGWKNLTCLPDLGHLTALKTLKIWDWEKLEALPEWLGNLSSLQSLDISFSPNLMSLPSREAIQRLANLRSLVIFKCPILAKQIEKGSGEEWHKIARIPLVELQGIDGAPCTYRYSQKVPYQF